MMWLVILSSGLGAFLSLGGGIILTMQKQRQRLASYAAAFAAGALLAAVAFDLLPHLTHESEHEPGQTAFFFVLIGILLFFVLELVLNHTGKSRKQSLAPMVIIGDTLHNLIDGAVIAAGFLISAPSGILVATTVAAHELPQEVGDFGLLLHSGMSRQKTITYNLVSAIFTVLAAAGFFALGTQQQIPLNWLLGLACGFFLYIAFHILLEIHDAPNKTIVWKRAAWLLAGLVIVSSLIELLAH